MTTVQADVVVIGAGTAGLAAFRAARTWTPSVVLVEAGVGGTTCARQGCMPSKLLIAAADAAHGPARAARFGVRATAQVDGPAVLQRVRAERDRFVGFVHAGVAAFPPESQLAGHARFLDDHTLDVGGTRVIAGRVVVATGSRPLLLPGWAALGDRLITSDAVFEWPDLPESVLVLGPGAIGLELGQSLARLGVRTRVLGVSGSLAGLTDPVVKARALAALRAELPVDLDHRMTELTRVGDAVRAVFEVDGVHHDERFELVLAAVGRVPNLDLGLERTSVPLDGRGRPIVDPATLRAGDSPIFFAGDVAGIRPLLHEAADEGRIAGDNAGRFPDVQPGLRRTPLAMVFCDPQIATVGQPGAPDAVIGEVSFDDQGRSRVMGRNAGHLRLFFGRDRRLLGAEGVGPDMEHLAHLIAWSQQAGLTVDQMLDMPFYHPVVEEGLRTALRDARARLDAAAP